LQVNNIDAVVLNLRIVGASMMLLAILHAGFYKRFDWKDELPKLSLLNRQIFYVHVFFIALALLMQGFGCIFFAPALCEKSTLADAVSAGMCVYWLIRLIFQFVVYDKKLWQGKKFETSMHIVFTLLWLYYVVVFGWLFMLQRS
jgi:hypothetical protein